MSGYRSLGSGGVVNGGLYLPGISGNYASTPDEAGLNITGDIDLRIDLALADWTPTAPGYLISKLAGGGTRSYAFALGGDAQTHKLIFEWSADGTAVNSALSTAIPSTVFSDGARGWVRVTFDVDNGASGRTATFYTSADGVTWTQLGDTVTTATATSIYASATAVEIGSTLSGTTTILAGATVYEAQIRNGISGTLVANPVFSHPASVFTMASTTGHDGYRLWTIHGTRWEWR